MVLNVEWISVVLFGVDGIHGPNSWSSGCSKDDTDHPSGLLYVEKHSRVGSADV